MSEPTRKKPSWVQRAEEQRKRDHEQTEMKGTLVEPRVDFGKRLKEEWERNRERNEKKRLLDEVLDERDDRERRRRRRF